MPPITSGRSAGSSNEGNTRADRHSNRREFVDSNGAKSQPRTDELSIGVDRELGRRVSVALAYVHKDGAQFIGWTDVGGVYAETTRSLANGSGVPVFVLVNAPDARRYLLTNADGYSLTYNGLVVAIDKRRSNG